MYHKGSSCKTKNSRSGKNTRCLRDRDTNNTAPVRHSFRLQNQGAKSIRRAPVFEETVGNQLMFNQKLPVWPAASQTDVPIRRSSPQQGWRSRQSSEQSMTALSGSTNSDGPNTARLRPVCAAGRGGCFLPKRWPEHLTVAKGTLTYN